jgi:hypothetical protein
MPAAIGSDPGPFVLVGWDVLMSDSWLALCLATFAESSS